VSEPLIPLNAANLRIIPHVHKYFTPFLQKPCKLIHYQTRSCRVWAIKMWKHLSQCRMLMTTSRSTDSCNPGKAALQCGKGFTAANLQHW